MKLTPLPSTIAACVLAAFNLHSAPIVTPVSSNFDTGWDGWTATVPADIAFTSSGGNPGGFLQLNDVAGGFTFVLASAKFLGDWSLLNNTGSLSFDHTILTLGGGPSFFPYAFQISGPGGAAEWLGTTPTGITPWTTITVPIKQASFNVTSGSWAALLANVTDARIQIEVVGNTTTIGETAGLDNVQLVPEPSSAMLLSVGSLFLSRRRRTQSNESNG